VEEDLPVLAGYPYVLDSDGLRPRCLRGRAEEWVLLMGCVDHGAIGRGSSECNPRGVND
jgi:hypothetical protein